MDDCEYAAPPGLRHRLEFRRCLGVQLSYNLLMLRIQFCKESNSSDPEGTLVRPSQQVRVYIKPPDRVHGILRKGTPYSDACVAPQICCAKFNKSACSRKRQIVNFSSLASFESAGLRHNSRLLCSWIPTHQLRLTPGFSEFSERLTVSLKSSRSQHSRAWR